MKIKDLCYICVLSILLTACGSSQTDVVPRETASPTERVLEVAEETETPTEEPRSTEHSISNNSEPQPTFPPQKGNYIERKNTYIEGRHYTFVKYKKYKNGKLRLISLKTNENALIIPQKIDGCLVVHVGADTEEVPGARWYDPDEKHGRLCWQKNKKQRIKKIVIPEGIKKIWNEAFRGVYAEKIILPKSLTKIDSCAFANTTTKKVVLKSKNAILKRSAFAKSSMEKIKFPNGFRGSIESGCFKYTDLKSFDWPNHGEGNENKVKFDAFRGCKSLKTVNFPENQEHMYISPGVFYGCESLERLVFPASTKKVTYRDSAYADNRKNGVSTLVFKGQDTEVVGDEYRGEGDYKNIGKYNYITVGKIIAPKNSKAIEFAKNAKKIVYMNDYFWEDAEMGDVQENYSAGFLDWVKLGAMEWEEI